mgnify:CR=1 FL=1
MGKLKVLKEKEMKGMEWKKIVEEHMRELYVLYTIFIAMFAFLLIKSVSNLILAMLMFLFGMYYNEIWTFLKKAFVVVFLNNTVPTFAMMLIVIGILMPAVSSLIPNDIVTLIPLASIILVVVGVVMFITYFVGNMRMAQ